MNKQVQSYFNKYIEKISSIGCQSLYDAYEVPSSAKKEAWDKILSCKAEYDGCNLSIIRKGVQYFTAGFLYKSDNNWCFMLYTPSDTIAAGLSDEQVALCKREGLIK